MVRNRPRYRKRRKAERRGAADASGASDSGPSRTDAAQPSQPGKKSRAVLQMNPTIAQRPLWARSRGLQRSERSSGNDRHSQTLPNGKERSVLPENVAGPVAPAILAGVQAKEVYKDEIRPVSVYMASKASREAEEPSRGDELSSKSTLDSKWSRSLSYWRSSQSEY
ncbi:hypothetical protein FGB62_146g09 [Gracilaria domingensis]|nr:hypothetical protein FGB62_146g09 [Gracilaria domingensis]